MIKNLITYEEISLLARPCTTDQERAEAMIAEAQREDIRPRLGDALYIKLAFVEDSEGKEDAQKTTELTGAYKTLVEGGLWTDRAGKPRLAQGLKTALAYYALARIIRDGNVQATTYGAVVKDDQYSMDPERSERQRQYRELFAQADGYMNEVSAFLAENGDAIPEYKKETPCATRRGSRTSIRIIGK